MAIGKMYRSGAARSAALEAEKKKTTSSSSSSSSSSKSSPSTVNIGTGSTAPSGLSYGSIVQTDGGQFKIVDANTPGAKLNPASGYYSVPVGAAQQPTYQQPAQPTLPVESQYYLDYMSDYTKQLNAMKAEQERAAQLQTQATVDSIRSNIPLVQQDYEAQQREAYIANARAQFGMQDYLSAMGYTGGMAETTALGLETGYQEQRRAADQEKNNALANIQNLVAQAQTTGDTNLANLASQYYQSYLAAMQSANQSADARAQWEAQYTMQQQQYQDQMAQQAWQNQFSQDQFTYQQQQDAIVNSLAQQKVVSGTKSTGSSGGSSKEDNEYQRSISLSVIEENARNLMFQYGKRAGQWTGNAKNAGIDYLESLIASGQLTEAQARAILQNLNAI